MVWKKLSKLLQVQETSRMLALQATTNNTKLADFAGLNVTKYHKILVLSLAAAYQMNCLPLNLGQIALKNHASPKDVTYQSLLARYIAEQTQHDGPENQYMALKGQLSELSKVYSDSKNDWIMVEKSADGYISQLKMDENHQNPNERKCYNCGSPDHFKKQCPHKKGDGARSEKKSGGKSGDQKKKWFNVNKDGNTELTKGDTKYYWCKSCGYGRGRWTSTHKPENCRYKKKGDHESSEEVKEGNLAMEIVECLMIL